MKEKGDGKRSGEKEAGSSLCLGVSTERVVF